MSNKIHRASFPHNKVLLPKIEKSGKTSGHTYTKYKDFQLYTENFDEHLNIFFPDNSVLWCQKWAK